ncbi:hypothetical protein FVEG_16977 [Fusarium verticillioides 7600]|uniref:Uncharacterized protein n=1 Tax=Gibberella moniliformis (strain M3125 / FGSC 7600) TaxID=334819 RepID=W7MMZ5_GIBM7|nr:hypothetical protein FVEG_16977 [Fusarium verticillioides 7600]EWG52431.1 hypothetical protein FVEG_16977 [Fusarium verticillioides 7600]
MNQRNTASNKNNNKKKTRKKVQFYRYLGKAQESIWFIIFIIWKEKNSALWVQTRSFGRCGMGDTLLPLLTRKRRLQAWQKLWYLFGGDGVRSTARDQLSRRQPESWGDEGWGPLKKVLRHLQCASFFATDRGELRPSELSTYSTAQHSTVDGWNAMHRTSTFTHQLGPHLDIGRHTTSLGRYSDDYLHEESL